MVQPQGRKESDQGFLKNVICWVLKDYLAWPRGPDNAILLMIKVHRLLRGSVRE